MCRDSLGLITRDRHELERYCGHPASKQDRHSGRGSWRTRWMVVRAAMWLFAPGGGHLTKKYEEFRTRGSSTTRCLETIVTLPSSRLSSPLQRLSRRRSRKHQR